MKKLSSELSKAFLLFVCAFPTCSMADETTYKCESDAHTLQEIAAWKIPQSEKVPAGFKIDNHKTSFVVTETVTVVRTLPIDADPLPNTQIVAQLRYGLKDTAVCRVQDQDGHWWLATGGGLRAPLWYVDQNDTQTLAEYNKAQEQSRKDLAEKQQLQKNNDSDNDPNHAQ